MTLGLEIKAELIRKQKTIEQLAKTIDISRGNLSAKLNNRIGFRSDELQKIGEALNVPASELLRRAEEAAKQKEKKG